MNDFNTKRVWGPSPRYPAVASRQRRETPYPILGGNIVIAGPCSVESERQLGVVLDHLIEAGGVTFLRGGVYRAGTYPPPEEVGFGLKLELLQMMHARAKRAGIKTIVEVLDVRQMGIVAGYADALQVGARHMQDYALLREAARFEGFVALKRHPGATLDEFLGAAEYLAAGRCKPILIERGSSSHMNHVRWDLSVSTIAAIKRMTNIPILVDASHGSGRRDLVEPLTLAGIAAGADGFLVEVHPRPKASLSDADQAYPLLKYRQLVRKAARVRAAARGE